jgi:Trp operon repressor
VSEAGFMMDNETFQKRIGHFVELRDKINGVKEELKTELKTDISTVTAGQEKLKTEINAGQEGLKSEISAVKMTSAL